MMQHLSLLLKHMCINNIVSAKLQLPVLILNGWYLLNFVYSLLDSYVVALIVVIGNKFQSQIVSGKYLRTCSASIMASSRSGYYIENVMGVGSELVD